MENLDLENGWHIFIHKYDDMRIVIGEVFVYENGEKACRLSNNPYDTCYLHLMFDRYNYDKAEPIFPVTKEKIEIIERQITHRKNAAAHAREYKFGAEWQRNIQNIEQLENDIIEYEGLLEKMKKENEQS